MKNRQQTIKHWKRVYEKNQLIFRKKFRNDKHFIRSLIPLLEKYYSQDLGETAVFSVLDPSREMRRFPLQDKNEYLEEAKTKIETLGEEMTLSLFEDTDELIRKFHFGQEWETCFIIFLTTGVLIPPHLNLDIRVFPTKPKLDFFDLTRNERVCIILNHDTSLDDIKYALDDVKKLQNEIQPGKSSKKNTKGDLLDKFGRVIQIEIAEVKMANMQNLEKLSNYELNIYKHGYTKKINAINKINELRRDANKELRRDQNIDKPNEKPLFKPRGSLTDEEFIRATGLKTKKAIKHEVDKIRKDRERYGK